MIVEVEGYESQDHQNNKQMQNHQKINKCKITKKNQAQGDRGGRRLRDPRSPE